MKLYNFHRSSASFRVRIALNLKGLPYDYVPVRLAWEGGENLHDSFRTMNRQGLLPVLIDGDLTISQSLAIFDYLDRKQPEPPLFPADDAGRARVLGLALYIACDIQPIQNLRIEKYLASELGADEAQRLAWKQHWIGIGFDALESMLTESASTGTYCHGLAPTAADCLLVPQVFNAKRSELDVAKWPTIHRIFDACMQLDAFRRAAPEHQPDAKRPSG